MRISLASDHAGFPLKLAVKAWLIRQGHDVQDVGCHSEQPVDWPDVIYPAALALSEGRVDRAILIDGAGYPSCSLAAMLWNVAPAVGNDLVSARLAREHSNANALCLGGKIIGEATALEAVRIFLETEFLGGKYAARLEKLNAIREKHVKGPGHVARRLIALEDLRHALLNKESLVMDEKTILTPGVLDLANGIR
ncbi:MAG: RpiB/LacA/LacB family sugar-phosphate isomerase [Candidatus Sumerlaeia bacterium]